MHVKQMINSAHSHSHSHTHMHACKMYFWLLFAYCAHKQTNKIELFTLNTWIQSLLHFIEVLSLLLLLPFSDEISTSYIESMRVRIAQQNDKSKPKIKQESHAYVCLSQSQLR